MAESQKYSREYVIDKTNYHNGNYTSPDDFIICMSPKVYSKYLQGVKPVVFNNKELALDAIIKKENILIIPNEQYKNDIDEETTPGTPE
ncbi:MAG: hypothetical protein HUJ61_02925 [Bacilli bacterium]|nr:hypothetical protein [Bacilli bacterium]